MLSLEQESDESGMEIEDGLNMEIEISQGGKIDSGNKNESTVPTVVITNSVCCDTPKVGEKTAHKEKISLKTKLASECITVPACTEKQIAEVRFTINCSVCDSKTQLLSNSDKVLMCFNCIVVFATFKNFVDELNSICPIKKQRATLKHGKYILTIKSLETTALKS